MRFITSARTGASARRGLSIALLATAFGGLGLTGAAATPAAVPDATVLNSQGNSETNNGNLTGFGLFTVACQSGAQNCSGQATTTYTFNDLTVTGSAMGGNLGVAQLSGVDAIWFIVNAPANSAGPVLVPITITASATTGGAFTNYIEHSVVTINANSQDPGHTVVSACSGISCGQLPSSFSGTYAWTPVYSGSLQVMYVDWALESANTAFFQFDPMVAIDATWAANNSGYTLALSPNFTTPDVTTGVPEPVTASLFGAGLLGAGLLRRRKVRSARG